jgi:thiol-disulfide isomerase/thioredoxin
LSGFLKKLICGVAIILSTGLPAAPSLVAAAEPGHTPVLKKGPATLYFFKGEGCPHCAEEAIFLSGLKKKYPRLMIKEFEVWHNKENAAFYSRVIQGAGVQRAGVPGTVIGKKLFIGYNAVTGQSIENAVAACIREGCADTLAGDTGSRARKIEEEQKSVAVPFLGELDPEKVSLPLLTIVIGALDSFNPCAFFVLLFLLSMLIHARSRAKMLFIGGVFVFFSGLIYFLFMAAWLNLFLIIGGLTVITVTAGIVALIVAGINIKDFFLFKKGVSLVIPEKAKPKLYGRMRGLLGSSSLPAMLTGTAVLAVTANAYELLCTAGFPMLYTRALTLHKLSTLEYYLYLAFYNLVYVIPLAVIVVIVTLSLGARKLTEWQGRQLKLLSGLMMLCLGLILLINPALLNSIATTGGLLLSVVIIAGLLIYGMKKWRPGIVKE